jgi:hypothetical protein
VGRWIAKSPAPAEQSPAPAERWTTRCLGSELPDRSYPLCGGPPCAPNILIVSRQRAQGRCFSDLRHSEAFEIFFTDQARYEKRSSTAKGLLLGVCFVAKGPIRRNIFGRLTQSRSYQSEGFGVHFQRHRLKDEMTNQPMIICIMIVDLCKGHECNSPQAASCAYK